MGPLVAMSASVLAAVLLIITVAAVVRSTFGFGDALVGMPLLALVIPLRTATPLMALIGPTLAFLMLARTWRRVDIRSTAVLIVATLAGIPFGIYILKNVREDVVNLVLAGVIILFALYSLVRPELCRLKSARSAPLFGLAAGVLGAATNTNGPPVVFYGALRGWEPDAFRATIQGYFLVTGPAILVGQGSAGLLTAQVYRAYLCALPLIVVAVCFGFKFGRRIPAAKFYRWIYALLLTAGLVLLLKTLLVAPQPWRCRLSVRCGSQIAEVAVNQFRTISKAALG
jgi:uncharacterized membrane protein YfcA